jgi:hypothetical protein
MILLSVHYRLLQFASRSRVIVKQQQIQMVMVLVKFTATADMQYPINLFFLMERLQTLQVVF